LKHIPVILVTALSDPKDVVRALECGADNFIVKPYDGNYLLLRIKDILANLANRESDQPKKDLEIYFSDHRYLITSSRLQILNLLLSTYETAVRQNLELIRARNELTAFNEQLELKVEERTAALQAEVAERRWAEEEIQKLNEELEERVAQRTAELRAVNHELEAFSYSVSHDLRAPLRSIEGFSNMLLEEYAHKLDSAGETYLKRVKNAGRRMSKLIDDLLNLSRVTRSELRREAVDLSKLAGMVASDLSKAEADAAEFVIKPELVADADRNLLRIILENLVGNAIKFTRGRPNPRIEVGFLEREGKRAFFVRDNGVGFDMAYAAKLFGPFQRLHGSSEFEGTGIGLAIVQRIVHRHGGQVWAEGAPGEGATFYFTLSPSDYP
jgi:signal transduction histidine kinase